MILSPMLKEPYEGRGSDCEMALETKVHEIVDLAVSAGWNRKEAMAAVANIILNEMFAERASEQSDFWLAQTLGKVEH